MRSASRVRPAGSTLGLAISISLLSLTGAGCSDQPPPIPPQPIAFNHQVHLAEEISCTRCHRGAESAKAASLPPVSTCAACHRREATDHPEVQKLMQHWEEKEPIVWRKVNVMPKQAMVHFDHRAHALAEVECINCHGDMTTMTLARRVIDTADMGWCIDCHQQAEASVDCLTCHY